MAAYRRVKYIDILKLEVAYGKVLLSLKWLSVPGSVCLEITAYVQIPT